MSNWSSTQIANLRTILANLYPSRDDAQQIAEDAGLYLQQLDFSGSPINMWFKVLQYAKPRDLVDDILDVALAANPGHQGLKLAKQHEAPPPPVEGPETTWKGTQDTDALEKIMGKKSTLVPVAYLELGTLRSRSVVRIKRADGGSGTGFLAANNLIITNNHVLSSAEQAATSTVQFNYQTLVDGVDAPIKEFQLLPAEYFRTSKVDDWTAVRIGATSAGGANVSEWGMLELKSTNLAAGDHVNIIQHAGGGPKQVSFMANVVVFVGEGRVQYLTDTLPGSSGSPVFDANWNIVALHHSGGWLSEPNALSKQTYYRNEGILIDRIIAGIA